jgi:hypothetical protein
LFLLLLFIIIGHEKIDEDRRANQQTHAPFFPTEEENKRMKERRNDCTRETIDPFLNK